MKFYILGIKEGGRVWDSTLLMSGNTDVKVETYEMECWCGVEHRWTLSTVVTNVTRTGQAGSQITSSLAVGSCPAQLAPIKYYNYT